MSVVMSLIAFSLSVFVVALVLPSVRVQGFKSAFVVAVVYGLLKYFFHWLLLLVSLPFIIMTLGLFLFVINTSLLWITDKLIDGFEIDGLLNTLIASIFISFLDLVFRWILPWV